MGAGRRILIAGVGTHWGTELALRLERDPGVEQVIGIDTTPPLAELERTEFIEADIRSPLLSRLLPVDRAPTRVVHMRHPLVPGARQAAAGPPRHQRDRHAPAARRLRADGDARAGRASAARRRSTAASRPAPSFFTEDDGAATSRSGPGSSATSASSRATSRTSPAATPR